MLKRVLLAVMVLTMLGLSLTTRSGAAEPSESDAKHGGPLHPDCLDHQQPRFCTRIVAELLERLEQFNEAFAAPQAEQLATFYHEEAILFVGSTGRFFRGREAIRDEFFTPFIVDLASANVDLTAFHFQVLSANLVMVYGAPRAVVTFKDGSTVTLPPLPQTLTWVRQRGERQHSFVILADHE